MNVIRNDDLRRLRNLGIAAHIDAGKTTLTERVLFYAGAIHACGDVHDGNTTTDFSPIEQKKGITIASAAAPCVWRPCDDDGLTRLFAGETLRLNLIDTPGHVDFTAEVERSLRVLDGAIAVFCGVAGVQPQSETVWRQATRHGVPRLAFINKMDRVGANFARVLEELRTKLRAPAAAVALPLGAEDQLRGVLDVIEAKALVWDQTNPEAGYTVEDIPSEQQALAAAARSILIERLAESDEAIAELWLASAPVDARTLKQAIRRQTIAGRFVPVLGGSAYKHIGVQPLVDAACDYLPSPADLPAFIAQDGSSIRHDAQAPLAALGFKVVRDKLAGRLVFVRVYAGVLRKGDSLLNPRTGRTERAGRLLRVFADQREELAEVRAGDICAVTGLKGFTTGDTLCDPQSVVSLEPPIFPEPVVSLAIEPAGAGQHEKLAEALARVSDEDPTFRVATHPETGQCLISGMGELHLEVIRERFALEFGLETTAGAPEIACRETVTASAKADHLLKKQTGGSGMYARVALEIAPRPRGSGLLVEEQVRGGVIPPQFLNAVRRGIEEAATTGPLGGHPLTDLHVQVTDGAFHAKDSNELAFRLAAAEALREAVAEAQPVVLEPVMRVECTVPDDHQGDILGDLLRRRGRVSGVEAREGFAVVTAEVPLVEMFGYTNAIRSLSRGRASYAMTPSAFEVAPEGFGRKATTDK